MRLLPKQITCGVPLKKDSETDLRQCTPLATSTASTQSATGHRSHRKEPATRCADLQRGPRSLLLPRSTTTRQNGRCCLERALLFKPSSTEIASCLFGRSICPP